MFGTEAKTGLLDDASVASRSEGDSGSSMRQIIKLIFCAAGLQVGILPENTVIEYIWSNPYNTTNLFFCLCSSRNGCFMFVLFKYDSAHCLVLSRLTCYFKRCFSEVCIKGGGGDTGVGQ